MSDPNLTLAKKMIISKKQLMMQQEERFTGFHCRAIT